MLGPTGDILSSHRIDCAPMADGGFRNQLHEPYCPAFEITIGLKEDSAFMTARSKAG